MIIIQRGQSMNAQWLTTSKRLTAGFVCPLGNSCYDDHHNDGLDDDVDVTDDQIHDVHHNHAADDDDDHN